MKNEMTLIEKTLANKETIVATLFEAVMADLAKVKVADCTPCRGNDFYTLDVENDNELVNDDVRFDVDGLTYVAVVSYRHDWCNDDNYAVTAYPMGISVFDDCNEEDVADIILTDDVCNDMHDNVWCVKSLNERETLHYDRYGII